MSIDFLIQSVADYILFASCLFILACCVLLTFKTRFIQLRLLPTLFRLLRDGFRDKGESSHTVPPLRALVTAMSTTLGIGTIVAPTIAISLGGPGALLGFLLTAFFGSAATYTEVSLSIQHRKKVETGMMGGPMQYMQAIFSSWAAKWYAVGCLVLMVAWSGANANQLAAILDSPILGGYRTPTMISGAIIAACVLIVLLGGIKRVSSISAKIVPAMFALYIGSSLWILISNVDQWGHIFGMMFQSTLSPYALASGTLIGGIVSALRWGIFKGIQACEAGIGTQAIPHAMAETKDPMAQGALAMLSTYTAGFVAFLSGCVALLTNTWQDPELPLGISMVAASFQQHFSYFGVAIVVGSTLLFGFGTILGNSFNGSQCFGFLTDNKKLRLYVVATAAMTFIGAIAEVKTFWSVIDIVLACVAIPHITTLMVSVFRKTEASELALRE